MAETHDHEDQPNTREHRGGDRGAKADRPPSVRVVTVTVSDSRDAASDLSGPAVVRELIDAEVAVVRHVLVRDDRDALRALVREVVAAGDADAVVFTGGTGIAPRDTTFEALAEIYEKTLDGFGEAFRRLSWDEIGPLAMLSRASAGVVGKCLVFSLPGSTKGATLGTKALIVPVLRHAVELVHGRATHPHAKHEADGKPADTTEKG